MSWASWRKRASSRGVFAVALCVAAGSSPAWAGAELLTLRVSDAAGVPGGRVAVVLRTYAPRGVGQGQICLRSAVQLNLSGGNGVMAGAALASGSPFEALEGVVVFSDLGDASHQQSFDGALQTTLLQFSSLSGSINATDGPLAVLYYRLRPDLIPGQTYSLSLDLTDSFLNAADGAAISITSRGGVLSIRAPGAPWELRAAGDRVVPGATAVLGIETRELFPITGGTVGFHWDPTVAAGDPTVTMDSRHGQAEFWVDRPAPGLLVVTLVSPDGSLNGVPGDLVSIHLPTRVRVPVGTLSPLSLDPGWTRLTGLADEPLSVERIDGVLEFAPPVLLFAAGFENGGLGEWSTAVP